MTTPIDNVPPDVQTPPPAASDPSVGSSGATVSSVRTIEDFKRVAPQVYEAFLEAMMSNFREYQNRMLEEMKKIQRESQGR